VKNDKTSTPAVSTESEQLATLRTKQERHERLSREHAASARRIWLRRILLEVDQEQPKEDTGTPKKADRQGHAAE
jgi:hypothetical protein